MNNIRDEIQDRIQNIKLGNSYFLFLRSSSYYAYYEPMYNKLLDKSILAIYLRFSNLEIL